MTMAVRPVLVALGVAVLLLIGAVLTRSELRYWVSGILVVLAATDCYCTWIVYQVARRNPEVSELQSQFERFLLSTFAGCALGILGGNVLTGSHLPAGAGFFLLVIAAVMMSVPLLLFIVSYHRRNP